jgi:long-chain acyl-CoA synthetase
METPNGPEPCAVLAVRGNGEQAAVAVEKANTRLADYQRIRRWVLWPEPDLPRTSTGKVKRKPVESWLATLQSARAGTTNGKEAFSAGSDWLLAIIAEISGEKPPGTGDELRLSEDLHLDSLGRVQLAAALEERLGVPPPPGAVDQAQTLGDLRQLVGGEEGKEQGSRNQGNGDTGLGNKKQVTGTREQEPARRDFGTESTERVSAVREQRPEAKALEKENYVYPRWPWWKPLEWARVIFLELLAMPLVRFLGKPRIVGGMGLRDAEPMLVICNHVTTYDGPLVEYALPGPMRRRLAVAMSGEMLEDFRHFRNPERKAGERRFMLFGPAAYYLLTALFNVFPLPRRRDFQRSFAHAGEALDRGMNVMVFPEGTRSATGKLAQFRPGIGLLAKQAMAPVLPVAINGLDELKAGLGEWFRSGKIEVRVGKPIRFAPEETEAAITERLHAEVEKLLNS